MTLATSLDNGRHLRVERLTYLEVTKDERAEVLTCRKSLPLHRSFTMGYGPPRIMGSNTAHDLASGIRV